MKKRIHIDSFETEDGLAYCKVPQVLIWRFFLRIVGQWFTPCSNCQDTIDEVWRVHGPALSFDVKDVLNSRICGKCKKQIQEFMLNADRIIVGNKDYEPLVELQRSWVDLDDHIVDVSASEFKDLQKRFGNTIDDSAIVDVFFLSNRIKL